MVEIYDSKGVKRDGAWLSSKYGNIEIQFAGEGEAFRLVRIDENYTGQSGLKVTVLNEDGHVEVAAVVHMMGLRNMVLPSKIGISSHSFSATDCHFHSYKQLVSEFGCQSTFI